MLLQYVSNTPQHSSLSHANTNNNHQSSLVPPHSTQTLPFPILSSLEAKAFKWFLNLCFSSRELCFCTSKVKALRYWVCCRCVRWVVSQTPVLCSVLLTCIVLCHCHRFTHGASPVNHSLHVSSHHTRGNGQPGGHTHTNTHNLLSLHMETRSDQLKHR